MAYTVKQVARISGVSVRTLHFYDELGLLNASAVTVEPGIAPSARRVSDLAQRVEGRLVATGVQAYLTHQLGAYETTEVERAEFANRADAHLCISLQVDAAANHDAAGVSTYFFGLESHGAWSSAGERFAGDAHPLERLRLPAQQLVLRRQLRRRRLHAHLQFVGRHLQLLVEPRLFERLGQVVQDGDHPDQLSLLGENLPRER